MRHAICCPMCGEKMGSLDMELARTGFHTAMAEASADMKMIGGIFTKALSKVPAEKLNAGISRALQMAGALCNRCDNPAQE